MERCEVCLQFNCPILPIRRQMRRQGTEISTLAHIEMHRNILQNLNMTTSLEQIVSGKIQYKPTLNDEGKMLLEKLREDITCLNGALITMCFFKDGQVPPKYFFLPTFVEKAYFLGEDLMLRLKTSTPIGEIVYDVLFWQVKLSASSIKKLFPSIYKEKKKQEFVDTILKRYRKTLADTAKSYESYRRSAEDAERNLLQYKKESENFKRKFDAMEKEPVTQESILAEIESIKTLKKVKDAYIGVDGNVVILTEELFACDYEEISESKALRQLIRFIELFNARLMIFNVVDPAKKTTFAKAVAGVKLETVFENIDHSLYFPENDDLVYAINDFVDKHNIDVLVMIPKKHNLFANLFQQRSTKKMAFHTHVPLLTIHD